MHSKASSIAIHPHVHISNTADDVRLFLAPIPAFRRARKEVPLGCMRWKGRSIAPMNRAQFLRLLAGGAAGALLAGPLRTASAAVAGSVTH